MSYKDGVITKPIFTDNNGGDVGRAIGYASGDIGSLCSYHAEPNNIGINKWSKYKPVRHNSKKEIPQENFATKNIAFGFDIDNIIMRRCDTLFETASKTKEWEYLLPRGAKTYDEWYRILDFDGYDANATDLFDYSLIPSTKGAPLNSGYLLALSIKKKVNRGFELTDFSFIDGSTFNYGILYKEPHSDTLKLSIGNRIDGVGEPFEDRIQLNLPITNGGEYKCLFVATEKVATDNSDSGEIMWLSNGRFNIDITAMTFICMVEVTSPFNPSFNPSAYTMAVPYGASLKLTPPNGIALPLCYGKFGIRITLHEFMGDPNPEVVEVWDTAHIINFSKQNQPQIVPSFPFLDGVKDSQGRKYLDNNHNFVLSNVFEAYKVKSAYKIEMDFLIDKAPIEKKTEFRFIKPYHYEMFQPRPQQ